MFGVAYKDGCVSADASGDEDSAGAVSITARSASQSPAALRNAEDELDAMIAGNALQPAAGAHKQVGHTLSSMGAHITAATVRTLLHGWLRLRYNKVPSVRLICFLC